MQSDMQRRLIAEFIGTFWLVFGGCGAAVISAAYPQLGIGFTGVAFAFGLTVLSYGLCSRSHFRRALQSCGDLGPVGGRPLRQQACGALCHRPGHRRDPGGRWSFTSSPQASRIGSRAALRRTAMAI